MGAIGAHCAVEMTSCFASRMSQGSSPARLSCICMYKRVILGVWALFFLCPDSLTAEMGTLHGCRLE